MIPIQMAEEILRLENISYIRNDQKILNQVSFQLFKNENLVILGKNGSGKSTLLNILFGFYWASSGSVFFFQKEFGTFPIIEIQKRIGSVLPNQWEDRIQKNISIKEVLLTGLNSSLGIYKSFSKEEIEQVEKMILENAWLKDANLSFSKCSSGERKKILLLRALVKKPEILILDEPCSSLDISSKIEFFMILERYLTSFSSIILITHSLDEIKSYFNKILFLKNGEVLNFGNKNEVLNSENISNCFDIQIKLKMEKENYFFI